MYRLSTPREGTAAIKKERITRRQTGLTPSSRFSLGSNTFEKEAMQVFNQVQANRQRILKKDSSTVFYSKTTVKTCKFDAEGKEIIEKYESTAYGGFNHNGEKIGEISQQYVNQNTGLEKSSLQRMLGNKLRRIEVKKTFDFETTDEVCENIEKDFDKEWKNDAQKLGVKKIIGFEAKANSLSFI